MEIYVASQVGLSQNLALLLQILCTAVTDFYTVVRGFCTVGTDFAHLLQIFALFLPIVALLVGINSTEIDQSQSSIISVYITKRLKTYTHIQA